MSGVNKRLYRHIDSPYTLSWLQRLYGRKKEDVTRTVPKRGLRVGSEWQRRALEFVKQAYKELGGPVTVRQVHYYLVGLNLKDYKNDLKHYNKLVKFLLRARIVGEIEWKMITETESLSYIPVIQGVTNIEEALERAAEAIPPMGRDPWDEIGKHVYVFTEKRELFSQINNICEKYLVPLVSFKGYGAVWTRVSQLAPRIREQLDKGHQVWALVISDHDPSGLDINRFYMALLKVFHRLDIGEVRVALTAKQIIDYQLPPNPAKTTDPRFKWYQKEFGNESWEVDALVTKDIKEMQKLLEESIKRIIGNDMPKWRKVLEENEKLKEEVKKRLREKLGG